MIGHGVKGTFEAAVDVQWLGVGAVEGGVPERMAGRSCRLTWATAVYMGWEVAVAAISASTGAMWER